MPQENPLQFANGNSYVMHYQMYLDLLSISDHALVNIGLHEETTSTETFTSLIRFFIDTLSEDMKKRPVTKRWAEEHGVSEGTEIDLKNVPSREHRRHAFYLSEPVHFQGLHGYSDFFMRPKVVKDGVTAAPSNESSCIREGRKAATASVAEGLLRGELNYIDPTGILVNEGQLHLDHFPLSKGDCAHYCFMYEHYQARWAMIASLFSGNFATYV
jgi:hypothetical protein